MRKGTEGEWRIDLSSAAILVIFVRARIRFSCENSKSDGVTLQKHPSSQKGETLRGVSRGCCPGTARRGSEQQKYSQIVVQMLPTVKVVPWRDWMALAAALPRAS